MNLWQKVFLIVYLPDRQSHEYGDSFVCIQQTIIFSNFSRAACSPHKNRRLRASQSVISIAHSFAGMSSSLNHQSGDFTLNMIP